MLKLSEPRIMERGPYLVAGMYCPYEGEDEGPGWVGATRAFTSRRMEITNQVGDLTLGFLYRPHNDHPDIDESVKTCFIGVEVDGFERLPPGMSTTRFSGGKYVITEVKGDTQDEASEGVGTAIMYLMDQWIPGHGYKEGDACFAASRDKAVSPPFIEYVYIKIEEEQK